MSAPTQADLLRVLVDRAEQDGGFSIEVRQWIADHLTQLKILGPWQTPAAGPAMSDVRLPLCSDRGAAAMCELEYAPERLPRWRGVFRGAATDATRAPRYEDATVAREHADRGAKAHGWVLADRPLERLARRLLQLGEHAPAVEDMLDRTHPRKSFAGHYETYGHDPVVRDCLTQLGFLPQPDASWLTEIELCHPGAVHSYEGVVLPAVLAQHKHLHDLPLLEWAERFYLLVRVDIKRDEIRDGERYTIVTLHTTAPLAGARVRTTGGGS